MTRVIISVVLVFFSSPFFGQEEVNFDDLQAIKNDTHIFYNIGGYTITTQDYSSPFTDKKLKPIFRDYKIRRKKRQPEIDTNLNIKHYRFSSSSSINKEHKSYYVCYFIENRGRTSVVTFAGLQKPLSSFMTAFIKKFLKNDFSKEIYAARKIDSIKFTGRYIKLGPACRWMGVRNVQCSYNGQMDWTIHGTLEDARKFNQIREAISTHQRKLKVVSRDSINIQFEGVTTKALKVVYDVKGINSFLLNLQSGAKNLIVYYVAEKIRNKYVSCILSHWNNDRIQPNGLPALLGEVMKLKK
ncbi:hypothetical protein AAON49_01135 [Pseudotenacibaculum sp. MALMAid0570]|uniref:hypothetical protein n=1 Tax=Pseudotenacibaculum sp. MALMAid0570 TaxID=3143938 RepID=UPI0032E05481